MTKQELFDEVFTGLAKQRFTQSVKGDTCSYRMVVEGEVRRCAVGQVLSDDDLERMGKQFGDDILTAGLDQIFQLESFPDELREHVPMLEKLQDIHDGFSDPEEMRTGLEDFAIGNGLTVREVLQ
jgi:hypothetical protein